MKKALAGEETKIFIAYLLTSIAGGYILSHWLIDSIFTNADAYAPIQQAKTLIQGQANLFDIHLARIPSLFPDLAILSSITLLFPSKGGLDLLSIYGWIYSTLLLFFSSYFIKEAIAPKRKPLLEPLSITLISISLLVISPTARDAYGHMLTPAHHGGNILNTIIFLFLTLKLIRNHRSKMVLILFFALVIAGVASNKLFIFTGLIPSTYLLLRQKLNKKILGTLTLMTVLGWGIGSSLNAQCSPEISVNIPTTLAAIKQYWLNYGSINIASLLSVASLGIIFSLRNKKNKSDLILGANLEAALIAISISCLTFYIYVIFLSGIGVNIRYALMFFGSMPIFISLLIHTFSTSQKDYWLIGLIGLLVSIIYKPGYVAQKITQIKRDRDPIYELMRSRHFKSTRGLNTAIKFIKEKSLKSSVGFSDYWGAGIALESNSKLSIFPLHSSGEPDYWSLSPETLIHGMNTNQEKFFVISRDKDFLENIKQSLGSPLEHWGFNPTTKKYQPLTAFNHQASKTMQLLIYKDNATIKRIAKHARLFKRNCDRRSPLHRVR